jgi:hypothetical protein
MYNSLVEDPRHREAIEEYWRTMPRTAPKGSIASVLFGDSLGGLVAQILRPVPPEMRYKSFNSPSAAFSPYQGRSGPIGEHRPPMESRKPDRTPPRGPAHPTNPWLPPQSNAPHASSGAIPPMVRAPDEPAPGEGVPPNSAPPPPVGPDPNSLEEFLKKLEALYAEQDRLNAQKAGLKAKRQGPLPRPGAMGLALLADILFGKGKGNVFGSFVNGFGQGAEVQNATNLEEMQQRQAEIQAEIDRNLQQQGRLSTERTLRQQERQDEELKKRLKGTVFEELMRIDDPQEFERQVGFLQETAGFELTSEDYQRLKSQVERNSEKKKVGQKITQAIKDVNDPNLLAEQRQEAWQYIQAHRDHHNAQEISNGEMQRSWLELNGIAPQQAKRLKEHQDYDVRFSKQFEDIDKLLTGFAEGTLLSGQRRMLTKSWAQNRLQDAQFAYQALKGQLPSLYYRKADQSTIQDVNDRMRRIENLIAKLIKIMPQLPENASAGGTSRNDLRRPSGNNPFGVEHAYNNIPQAFKPVRF